MAEVACVHCNEVIAGDVRDGGQPGLQRLRDHLIGCPSALRAVAPALPLFDREADVRRHFRPRQEPSTS